MTVNMMQEDALREERYAHLRIRKRRCDRTFMLCLAAGALLSAVEILLVGSMIGVAQFGRDALRGIVFFVSNFGIIAGMLLGICLRNRWLTAAALLLWGFNSFLQGQLMYYGSLACMIISLATEFEWETLRKKEGFPLFEIPIREKEQQEQPVDLTRRNLPQAPAETVPQDARRSCTPGEMDSI